MVVTAGEADNVEVTFSRYTATYPANTAVSFSTILCDATYGLVRLYYMDRQRSPLETFKCRRYQSGDTPEEKLNECVRMCACRTFTLTSVCASTSAIKERTWLGFTPALPTLMRCFRGPAQSP